MLSEIVLLCLNMDEVVQFRILQCDTLFTDIHNIFVVLVSTKEVLECVTNDNNIAFLY